MWDVKGLTKHQDVWVIEDDKTSSKTMVRAFPDRAIPNREDQKAVLSYHGCNGAIVSLHQFIKDILRNLCFKIDEVTFKVKNPRLKLVRAMENSFLDARTPIHNVLKVTLKDGDAFALDLTGAQHGWHDPLMPWDSFCASRVLEIRDVREFGKTAHIVNAEAEAAGEPLVIVHTVREEMTRCFDVLLKDW